MLGYGYGQIKRWCGGKTPPIKRIGIIVLNISPHEHDEDGKSGSQVMLGWAVRLRLD